MSDRVVVNTMNHRFVITTTDRIRSLTRKYKSSNKSVRLTDKNTTTKTLK